MNQETNKCDKCPTKECFDNHLHNIKGQCEQVCHLPHRYTSPTEKKEEKKCCGGLGLFGKCGRGTKTGCKGIHCRCMGKDCTNMHYVDCLEHYIHVEHIETNSKDSSSPTPTDKLSSQSRIDGIMDKRFGIGFFSLATPNEIRNKVQKALTETAQETRRELFEKVLEKLDAQSEDPADCFNIKVVPLNHSKESIRSLAKEYGIEL